MSFKTHEGIVENGEIELRSGARLPEKAKVYVIVFELQTAKKKIVRVPTPRLVHRKLTSDFKMKVTKERFVLSQ